MYRKPVELSRNRWESPLSYSGLIDDDNDDLLSIYPSTYIHSLYLLKGGSQDKVSLGLERIQCFLPPLYLVL